MLARFALAGMLAFVSIVAVEHALEPQLGPARHTISEYVNTGSGTLMTVAFAAWALSLLATAAVVWHDGAARARSPLRVVLVGLLAVASAGLALTACFATQTSAGVLAPGTDRTLGGHVHDLASLAAQVALLAAVVASIVVFRRRSTFRAVAATLLAGVVVSSAVLLSIGDPVDGIRQRVLVGAGCAWQAALVLTAARRGRP